MTARTWDEALDDFEARVVLAERWQPLAEPASEIPSFEPPELPDSLPAGLLSRAHRLLARADAAAVRLGAEQQRIRAELARTPRIAPGRQAGSTLDVHA